MLHEGEVWASPLERATPAGIVLHLDDGTTIEYPGPALEFYVEAQEQILRKRGPLYKAASHIVSATGFGKLYEVLLALVEGPVHTFNDHDRRPPVPETDSEGY